MTYLVSTFFAAVVLILSSFNVACAMAGSPLSMRALLDQQLTINAERYGIVGQSVLLLKNHQPLYQGQHGFANVELGVAITSKHLFPSYSITKLFTGVLMMQQVERENIKLTDSITTYLPYLPKRWQAVTIEHLLSHTSGIPRYFDIAMENRRFLPNKKAVFLSLIDQPDHFEIGTVNSYNNTNFLLLAAILEAQTGKSYQTLVAETIIKPLGLHNTGHASAKAIIKNSVTSYRGNNGNISKNINIDWPEYTFAHSALYSSPEDLTTFMTALVTGKFVSKTILKKLWQPMKLTNGKAGRYAFAFEYAIEDDYLQLGHDGGNQVKLRHYVNINNSADNYTLVYATNGNTHGVWTDVLAESLMSIVEPKKFVMPALKEQFITAILAKNNTDLIKVYQAISTAFDGDEPMIERFLLYRAYALKYGRGAESSLAAFEFLIAKFPKSAQGLKGLADTRAILNK